MFNIGQEVFPVCEVGYHSDWYSNEAKWIVYYNDKYVYEKDELEIEGYTIQSYRVYNDEKIEYKIDDIWFGSDDVYETYCAALEETYKRNGW